MCAEAGMEPPKVLYLPDGQYLLTQKTGDRTVTVGTAMNEMTFEGIFAESISALASDNITQTDRHRLRILERQHPELAGLSNASVVTNSLRQLLLGDGLGMLFVEVTAKCNERCIHCYADSSPERNEFLTLDEIKLALNQARELGRPNVQFTGGDPLIHKDLVPAVAHAAGLDFQGIEIYTNGLLLSDALLTMLAPYQPRMSFSVYADSAKVHDAITRVPGSWKRTIDAMRRTMAAGLQVRAGVVLMPENMECAGRMSNFLESELGMDARDVHFDPIKQTGRGRFMDDDTGIMVAPSHAPMSGPQRRGKLCISADGNVYPCIFARHVRLGNIRAHTLEEILSGLDHRQAAPPSSKRWQMCQKQLSCTDCQIIAYVIGENTRE
jgi:radical SAM protein with 4Fe4S-binding SPASM domain